MCLPSEVLWLHQDGRSVRCGYRCNGIDVWCFCAPECCAERQPKREDARAIPHEVRRSPVYGGRIESGRVEGGRPSSVHIAVLGSGGFERQSESRRWVSGGEGVCPGGASGTKAHYLVRWKRAG